MERYEILEQIGVGGFSKVYKVIDTNIGTFFVAKEISDREVAEREAEWLRILKHPGIPKLHDVIKAESGTIIIMEYIEGDSLKDMIEKGAFASETCREFMVRLTEIMEVLHSQNIPVIHGDLKPENIILCKDGKVALLDLGAAAYFGKKEELIYGTKGYIAPERMEGCCLIQNDIFSAGKIMQYMITGCDPSYFSSMETKEIVRYFNVEKSLADIIICATHSEPDKRYVSAKHLQEALLVKKEVKTKIGLKNSLIWLALAFLFLIIGFVFSVGNDSGTVNLFEICGFSLVAVALLVRREEKRECTKILACEYSLRLSE